EEKFMTVRFDDSLPKLVDVVVEELGSTALGSGIALRDTMGRLAFFAGTPLQETIVDRVSAKLRIASAPMLEPIVSSRARMTSARPTCSRIRRRKPCSLITVSCG